jgi:heat-inducible transcriptional repressor
LSGLSNLFSQPEFSRGVGVKEVAKLLDNLEPWMREVAPGKPLSVYIGSENPIGGSSGCSLIISKFSSPYSKNSYIGVLGPTRQSYAQVMRLVKKTGELLEKAL